MPQSQQQAQDTLLEYFKCTIAAPPNGTVLDAPRYGSAGHNSWCDDAPLRARRLSHADRDAAKPGCVPTLSASTPCCPAGIAVDDVVFPVKVTTG